MMRGEPSSFVPQWSHGPKAVGTGEPPEGEIITEIPAMEPRPEGRGDPRGGQRGGPRGGPAMEPRPEGRGDWKAVIFDESHYAPQWSHGPKAVGTPSGS